jgi:hypothetical protein
MILREAACFVALIKAVARSLTELERAPFAIAA